MIPTRIPQRNHLLRNTAVTTLAALLAIAATAQAQTDNFNSGGFPAGWATSQSSNYPATFELVSDGYGGSALHMACTTSAVQTNGGLQYTPRAMAWMTSQLYSNSFYMAVDIVGWNTSTDTATNDLVFGLAERFVPYSVFVGGYYANSNVPVGQPDTVIFSTRINANGGTNSGTRGNVNMYWITAGFPNAPIAQAEFPTFVPGHSYRMVFMGTNDDSGRQYLFGYVYDLQDLTRPLVTLLGSDGGAPGYLPGGVNSGTNAGYPALMSIGYRDPSPPVPPDPLDDYWATNRGADVTFDNFVASALPPTSVSFPGTPHGLLGIPQVVDRTPASFANFYAPAGGIVFNATTLTTTNTISTIRLFLNGVDVSSGLVITGQTTNRHAVFSGLTSNVVYDARIELTDAASRKTTNIWTFDTFSDDYLASAGCRNIEAEDYDFGGGSFIDNPPASGFSSNSTSLQAFITGFNTNGDGSLPSYLPGNNVMWTNAINSGSGYVNRYSVKGTDYFDYDNVGNYTPYLNRRAGENQFNQTNSAGTTQGSLDDTYSWYDSGGAGVQLYSFPYDTQRQKYSSVDPSLQEYTLTRTEGGEWYNYTRTIFYSSNYYNVYLRHGCGFSQPVRLDQIAAGPATNTLGTFFLTSALARSNFKYAPLRDGSGKLAVVNLPTGNNTLRLTMAAPQGDSTQRGLNLNYLAFVPSVPQLYSSATVSGTYTPELNVLVDTGIKKITVPQSGLTRFYRIGWTSQVTIKSVNLVGGNVVLTYQ